MEIQGRNLEAETEEEAMKDQLHCHEQNGNHNVMFIPPAASKGSAPGHGLLLCYVD